MGMYTTGSLYATSVLLSESQPIQEAKGALFTGGRCPLLLRLLPWPTLVARFQSMVPINVHMPQHTPELTSLNQKICICRFHSKGDFAKAPLSLESYQAS